MQNLNKENLFNGLQVKYPQAMDKFYKWIDKFKADNNWDVLFNAGYEMQSKNPKTDDFYTTSPKFHDLPLALQAGILAVFFLEEDGGKFQEGIPLALISIEQDFKQLNDKLNGTTSTKVGDSL